MRLAGYARSWWSDRSRFLDQRLGLFAPRGARAYGRFAPAILDGLYQAVAAEARDHAKADMTIVDIGTGPGALLVELARALPSARIIGIEPVESMRQAAADRIAAAGLPPQIEILAGRAEALPIGTGSADVIVSTLSAHHWSDPVAAFAELSRCLKSGGQARIYDVRFAAFGESELRRLGRSLGLRPGLLRRRVSDLRVGPVRPFAIVTLDAA